MSLKGELSTFTVTSSPAGLFGHPQYPIFTSGDLSSKHAVIFIGGLFNGPGGVSYVGKLSEALETAGWKLVQMHWTGAFDGFGTGSLDRDIDEMEVLVNHLRAKGDTTIVIMGHSTGSQDVIHYLTNKSGVDGGIMQAPVSDREWLATGDKGKIWRDQIPIAEEMMANGRGTEVLDQSFCEMVGARISADRLFSLVAEGGYDDYFSSDLPNHPDGVHLHPLSDSFGRLSVPALALFSSKDQENQLGDKEALMERWMAAAEGKLEAKMIEGASHDITEEDARADLCEEVIGWLSRVVLRTT
ncbi:hypothetical protein P7C73_g1865, partial [Tremellales sp. Uapishka_1]